MESEVTTPNFCSNQYFTRVVTVNRGCQQRKTHDTEEGCARRLPPLFPPALEPYPAPPPPPREAASCDSALVAPAATLCASGGETPALNSHISMVSPS